MSARPVVPIHAPRNGAVSLIKGGGNGAGGGDDAAVDEVLALNDEYALVLLGSGPVVLRETDDDEGRPYIQLLSIDGFKEWLRPRKVRSGDKMQSVAPLWLAHPERRQFEGLGFEPLRETPGRYNLWRGFGAQASPEGSCQRLLDHVYENVCRGNDGHFAWVIGWFAQMVQRPTEKLGTSLVLRGTQGTGKTILGKAIGELLGPHYQSVSDPRFITGRFNSHLVSTLLLQADEGFWAGDHTAEGKLKDLVTGDVQLIEYKGKEPVRVKNYVRLMITSNSQWVVPAGLEERRFAVFDVGDARRQDHRYFGAITQELESGGYQKLLHYLLSFDLDGPEAPNLRQVPATAALYEQKLKSLTPEEQWWLDLLRRGALPGDTHGRGETPCAALYDHYIEHAKRTGIPRRAAEVALGMWLKRHVPGLQRHRRTVDAGGQRAWRYEFPPLAACRAAFDAETGQEGAWGSEQLGWDTDSGGGGSG